jgi:TonB family protein
MSALAIAMLLTGAAEVQRGVPIGPRPPDQVPVVAPPAPPLPVAQQPVMLRSPPYCFPTPSTAPYPFDGCFHPSDYPLDAYAARQQGTVRVRLIIARDRAATRCEVTAPSGSDLLDRETCEMLEQRALALEDGLVVSGQVVWVLPSAPPVDTRLPLLTYFSADDYPAGALRADEQGIVAFEAEISPAGRAIIGRNDVPSVSSAREAATCPSVRSRTNYLTPLDTSGRAVPGRIAGTVNWRLPRE